MGAAANQEINIKILLNIDWANWFVIYTENLNATPINICNISSTYDISIVMIYIDIYEQYNRLSFNIVLYSIIW